MNAALLRAAPPVQRAMRAIWRHEIPPGTRLEVLIGVIALGAIAAFVGVAILRLSYPFPLQITESASLDQVRRILGGQPIYVAPTLQYIPMIYGPIFFHASAALALVTGASYLPLRLVSLLASIGSLALIVALIYREVGNRLAALVGAGLFACTYPLADGTLDDARVDALFLFFVLAAIALAARSRSVLMLTGCGVLLGLAGLSKAPLGVAPIGLAVAIYLAFTVRWRTIAFVLGTLVVIALGLLLLRLQSGPWPTWYLWDLPRQHALNDHGDLLGRFWFIDTLPRFTFALLLGPAFLLARRSEGNGRPLLFFGLVGASLIGVSWASRTNSGGATNVLLPMFAVLALSFGLGFHLVQRELPAVTPRAAVVRIYLLALCALQLGVLVYNPRVLVPYRSEQWAAERLASALSNLPGSLYAPDLNAYVMGSDKGEQPFMGALGELVGGYGGSPSQEGLSWRVNLATALREARYSHVVIAQSSCCEVQEQLRNSAYVSAGPLFPPDDDYWRWVGRHSPTDLEVFVAPPP